MTTVIHGGRLWRWMVYGLAITLGGSTSFGAESDAAAADPPPQSVTTANPEIPIEYLELLLKPLTKEELIVEADAWRDLLKSHAQEIADLRISMKERELQQEATEEDSAEEDGQTSPSEAAEPPSPDNATAEEDDAAGEAGMELVERLPQMQEEKTHLGQRLELVLRELEAKGGDPQSYREYAAALSGIAMEVSDASSFWTVVQGWLTSETGGRRWAWNLTKFVLILGAFYFGARIAARLARKAASRISGVSQLLVDFLGKFVKQLLMAIGFIVALAALEVNITPLLATIGAAGFVIGFALQDTLSNFASGLLILAYQPFDVGDVIEAADVSGVVDSVSLFSTHVRTFDNKVMIVPNNDIWGGTITNATASDTRRVDMVFGIGYDDDIEQAKQILERLVAQHKLVLDEPAPVVRMHELADSSVNFVCRPWTKTGDYWTVYWEITRAVKEEFDRAGISIPYPQQDVHVHQASNA